MKVKSLGKNQTQIEFEKDNKYIALFISYETPVAALIHGLTEETDKWIAYKTNVYYSVTTTRHINQWLKQWAEIAEEKDQTFFDNLMR